MERSKSANLTLWNTKTSNSKKITDEILNTSSIEELKLKINSTLRRANVFLSKQNISNNNNITENTTSNNQNNINSNSNTNTNNNNTNNINNWLQINIIASWVPICY